MKFCNYCHRLIPSGYDIWWNQRAYHPDCAVQVAVTETNRNSENNRNTANNHNTTEKTERREEEMNCKYCDKHIVATCQVMWRGYPYHEDCLATAIQQQNQPQKSERQLRDEFLDEEDYENFEPDYDAEEDYFDDEDFVDEAQPIGTQQTPERTNGQTTEPEFAGQQQQSPKREVHINEVTAAAAREIAAERSNGNHNENAGTLITHCGARRMKREELADLPTPEETKTFKPISHFELVERITETLWFRRMNVVRDEYAVSADGMKLFGLLEMDLEYKGVRFAIGIRNSNDKSMRLGMVAGYRVRVCDSAIRSIETIF